jgi:alginate O-acetyltransferase complex protein AlgI
VGVLLLSVGINYLWGCYIGERKNQKSNINRPRFDRRKAVLWIAVMINIGMLGLTKSLGASLGFPLGMSFYTFQALSYLIDVYRGTIDPEHHLLSYANAICMFPKLISGPLVRYGDISTQLKKPELTSGGMQSGLMTFIYGLALKVLLADPIATLWNAVQVTGFISLSVPMAWLGAIAYSMNLYFDFYGYSMMAVGLGQMIGLTLPDNFDHPYMATSVREFYRKWHMTLTGWFRDYVYIPLGGNRAGKARTYFNLFIVWFLTGIWHGSSLNFLLWSMSLFLFIALERLLCRFHFWGRFKILPHIYVCVVIPVTWMCFAITDFSQLLIYLGRMFGMIEAINAKSSDWMAAFMQYRFLLLAGLVACTPVLKFVYQKIQTTFIGQLAIGTLFWLCIWRIWEEGQNVFRYFSF